MIEVVTWQTRCIFRFRVMVSLFFKQRTTGRQRQCLKRRNVPPA